jgi:hypothetical protein
VSVHERDLLDGAGARGVLATIRAIGGSDPLSAVPDLPRRVAWPLALGAWTNASAFGVLALRPELKEHPLYKASAIASFATVSWGTCGLAALGVKRRIRAQPNPK